MGQSRSPIGEQRPQSGVDGQGQRADDIAIDTIGESTRAVAVEIMSQRHEGGSADEGKILSVIIGDQRAGHPGQAGEAAGQGGEDHGIGATAVASDGAGGKREAGRTAG